MGLEVGEPYEVIGKSSVVDACFESRDTFDEVYDLVGMPLEGSRDVFMSHSLGYNNVLPNLLDHSHVSPICSLPSPSPEYYMDVPIRNPMICGSNIDLGYEVKMFNMLGGNVNNYFSIGYFRGYDPPINPYCVSLEDFDKVKRILNLFGVILVIASYSYFLNYGPKSLMSSRTC